MSDLASGIWLLASTVATQPLEVLRGEVQLGYAIPRLSSEVIF